MNPTEESSYPCSVRKEALGDTEAEDLYRVRELLAEWVRYYNEERLHSALEYLRPIDYYRVTRRYHWRSEKRGNCEKQPPDGRR